jgi:hypothetical protein
MYPVHKLGVAVMYFWAQHDYRPGTWERGVADWGGGGEAGQG